MPNHLHLLLRAGPEGISHLMQRLGTGYASYFNRKHGRVGHLFQNRFKSIVIEQEPYFLTAVRYVHLNPVKAGLVAGVEALAEYPWAGHGALMGRSEVPFQDIDTVLALLGTTRSADRGRIRRWMESGLGGEPDRDRLFWADDVANGSSRLGPSDQGAGNDSGDPRILGSPRFADSVLKRADMIMERRMQLRLEGWTLDRLITWVCRQIGASELEVREGRRTAAGSMARAAICHLARWDLGIEAVAIAGRVGVTPTAVAHALGRGRRIAEERSLGLEAGNGS